MPDGHILSMTVRHNFVPIPLYTACRIGSIVSDSGENWGSVMSANSLPCARRIWVATQFLRGEISLADALDRLQATKEQRASYPLTRGKGRQDSAGADRQFQIVPKARP